MTPPLPRDAVLLVVDVQKGMDVYAAQYNRNNPDLEKNIARLQAAWRKTGRPIIHVQHLSTEPRSPLRPGQLGVEIGRAHVELQSHSDLVCRLLLEKKKTIKIRAITSKH